MARLTTEIFIQRSSERFNNKFDYSLTEYKTYNEPLIIICPLHGESKQTPNSHLNSIHGCKKCAGVSGKSKTTEYFISKSEKIHNYKYDYSLVEYIKNTTKVKIICPIHGVFQQIAANHINGGGCIKCRNDLYSTLRSFTKEEYIEKANLKHNKKYDYSLLEYTSGKKKVKIICPIHGVFEQEAQSHLRGCGCKSCAQGFNTFRKSEWIEKANGREGIFYIIKCWNDNEEFYKLGITYKSIKFRYRKSMMPYNWEVITEIKSFDLNYIWNLENLNKTIISKYRYSPQIYFEGCIYETFKDFSLIKLYNEEEMLTLAKQIIFLKEVEI